MDDDGECELVVGCSNGQILVYGWHMGLGDEGRPQMFEKIGGKVSKGRKPGNSALILLLIALHDITFSFLNPIQVSSAVMSLSVIGDGSAQKPICLVAGLETGTIEILDCCDADLAGARGRTSSLIRHDHNLASLPANMGGDDDDDDKGDREDDDERLRLVELGVGGGLPLPQCGWSGP